MQRDIDGTRTLSGADYRLIDALVPLPFSVIKFELIARRPPAFIKTSVDAFISDPRDLRVKSTINNADPLFRAFYYRVIEHPVFRVRHFTCYSFGN